MEILRQVWVHHYYWDADGCLRWRDGHALPPASLRFDSPYDTDAHYCIKRDTAWSGYRAHLTEIPNAVVKPLLSRGVQAGSTFRHAAVPTG
ncbi:IS1182 family transposase, partial [Streptomyces sp. NPDC059866]